jgi:succinylglutamate desuccinylase
VRQQSRDLNRAWDDARIEALRSGAPDADAEDAELIALDDEIEQARRDARGPVHVLDLHTTSGDGPPFTIAAGEASKFAASVPLTCLTGLLELLDGTMLVALSRRGVAGLVVESGRHDDPMSVDRAEAAIWLALSASGVLGSRLSNVVTHARTLLTASRRDLPPAMRVFHRHAIRAADGFRMRPGFRHFQRVEEGQVLADDANGEVRAPGAGFILMPLYQGTGNDGFFLAR